MNQNEGIQGLINEQAKLNRQICRLKRSLASIPLDKIKQCDKVMEKLVMCQDCIYQGEQSSTNNGWHFCDQFNAWTDEDDFCSMGEEKSNESDLLTESFFGDIPTKMDALFDIYGVREED